MPDIVSENKAGTDTSRPKVSVVIPLYNHAHYIREAVESVLGQSFGDFELIIINDGSTDSSEDVVKGITDKRIHYLSQENCGAAKTITRGLQLARGDYISVLNSDDVYDAKRLQECVTLLEGDPSSFAAFSHLEYIDEKGDFIRTIKGKEFVWANHDAETSFKDENSVVLDLLAGNFLITTSNLFCRKSVFEKIGYFSDLKYAHDYEFFLRLCYHFKARVIEAPLLKYRVHGANTLKEYHPEVSFEVGLTLASFFLRYDMRRYIPGDQKYRSIVKFLNSLNTYDSDRMVLTILLFGLKMNFPDSADALIKTFGEDPDNPFRKACINRLRKDIESERHGAEGWKQWREVTDKLIEKDKELQDAWRHAHEGWEKWKGTNDLLIEKNKEAHEGWQKWKETNDLLIEKNKEAHEGWQKWKETNVELDEKNRFISTLLNSRSYRLGRFLTWPIRKLMGRG